ncbi:MAG: C40 family peptidase [Crocinitomicaceae bacterium]
MRRILILFFISSVFAISGKAAADWDNRPENLNPEEKCFRDSITSFAQNFIGIPYKWGGATKDGFDCSGFVYFVFKQFGITVSRSSSAYEGIGEKVALEASLPGDIILFTGTDATKRKVGHLGIVLKNEAGELDFIHSSSSKKHFGVTITRYYSSGYVKRFLRVINVIS